MHLLLNFADIVLLLVAGLAALILFQPRLLRSPLWRATGTPLASIIGSGFLVAGPVLAHVAGNWAWAAMLALCAIAYLFGFVIRFNISHVEPLMEAGPPKPLLLLERASHLALAFAYFISVAYYLNLLAAFALKALGIINPELVSLIASGIILLLGLVGSLKGLHALENIEMPAVSLKLSLIAGLLAAIAISVIFAVTGEGASLKELNHQTGANEIGILLGLLILVQGFETSRYLGESYDPQTRIRTMRRAQLIATAIYFIFILLITPYFQADLPVNGGETQIIDMLRPLGLLIAPLIILTALASQLSAAVADMNGAGGLLEDASNHRLSVRVGYFITALVALIITCSANIFDIITYASKAFVLYYGLQSITALYLLLSREAKPQPRRTALHMALFSLAAIIALIVLIFGKSVE